MQQPNVSKALGIIQAASKLKKDTPHPSDNLELDLGLDSMERVELLVSLDQQMGANVPDSVASEIYTVRDLVDAVIAHSGAASQRSAVGWEEVINEPPGDAERDTIDHDHPIARAVSYFMALRLAQPDAPRLVQAAGRGHGQASAIRPVYSLA